MGIGRQLKDMGADKLNLDDFAQAIKDCVNGKPQMTDAEAQQLTQQFFVEQEKQQRARAAELGKAQKAEGEKYLEENGFEITSAEFTYVPNDLKEVTDEQRETIDKMVERLEEFDDVQNVYTNMK